MTSSLLVARRSCMLEMLLRLLLSMFTTSGSRLLVMVVTFSADCVTEDIDSIMET